MTTPDDFSNFIETFIPDPIAPEALTLQVYWFPLRCGPDIIDIRNEATASLINDPDTCRYAHDFLVNSGKAYDAYAHGF